MENNSPPLFHHGPLYISIRPKGGIMKVGVAFVAGAAVALVSVVVGQTAKNLPTSKPAAK